MDKLLAKGRNFDVDQNIGIRRANAWMGIGVTIGMAYYMNKQGAFDRMSAQA